MLFLAAVAAAAAAAAVLARVRLQAAKLAAKAFLQRFQVSNRIIRAALKTKMLESHLCLTIPDNQLGSLGGTSWGK